MKSWNILIIKSCNHVIMKSWNHEIMKYCNHKIIKSCNHEIMKSWKFSFLLFLNKQKKNIERKRIRKRFVSNVRRNVDFLMQVLSILHVSVSILFHLSVTLARRVVVYWRVEWRKQRSSATSKTHRRDVPLPIPINSIPRWFAVRMHRAVSFFLSFSLFRFFLFFFFLLFSCLFLSCFLLRFIISI